MAILSDLQDKHVQDGVCSSRKVPAMMREGDRTGEQMTAPENCGVRVSSSNADSARQEDRGYSGSSRERWGAFKRHAQIIILGRPVKIDLWAGHGGTQL